MKGLKSMRRAALAALLVGALSANAADTPAPAPVTVLKAAHLFDAAAGKIVSPGVVVVQGGKILAVGANAKVPDGAKIIDLGDATLSPGFIDAHVHMSSQDNGDWYKGFFDNMMQHPPEQALRA